MDDQADETRDETRGAGEAKGREVRYHRHFFSPREV
jgi:hypothetical protein